MNPPPPPHHTHDQRGWLGVKKNLAYLLGYFSILQFAARLSEEIKCQPGQRFDVLARTGELTLCMNQENLILFSLVLLLRKLQLFTVQRLRTLIRSSFNMPKWGLGTETLLFFHCEWPQSACLLVCCCYAAPSHQLLAFSWYLGLWCTQEDKTRTVESAKVLRWKNWNKYLTQSQQGIKPMLLLLLDYKLSTVTFEPQPFVISVSIITSGDCAECWTSPVVLIMLLPTWPYVSNYLEWNKKTHTHTCSHTHTHTHAHARFILCLSSGVFQLIWILS